MPNRHGSWNLSRRSTAYSDEDYGGFSRRSTLDRCGPDADGESAPKPGEGPGGQGAGDQSLAALESWTSEVKKLTPDQLALFLRNSPPEDFHDYADTLQQAIKKRVDHGKIFGLARKVRPIYDLVKNFGPIASAGSEFSPMPFSGILGGITSILSISVRVDDYHTKLVEMLTSMASELKILDKYRKESLFEHVPDVQALQIEVTTDILRFCVAATQIFFNDRGKEKNGLLFALKSQWKDFDARFGEIKTQFQRHLAELDKWRNFANSQQINSLGRGVAAIDKALEHDRGERRQAAAEQEEAKRRRKTEEKRRRVVSWLPSISFTRIQEDNYDRRVPGTGDWLMEHSSFNAWKESTESASLWVHGKSGSGKSHLAARVIHDLSQPDDGGARSRPAVAYAYCSSTQLSDKLNFNNILGSLLGQLYARLPPSQNMESIETKSISATKESASRGEMKEWIQGTIGKLRSCFIIIDGLDECSFFEENQFTDLCNFIASLTKPKDSSSLVKVIVFSRPGYAIISRALSSFPQIPIDKGANNDDIKRYISEKIDEIDSNPSEDQREGFEDIKDMMLGSANGMFLWVQLKVKDFREIGNVEDIKAALQDTSEGLDELYQKAIGKILSRSIYVRDRALKAILWVANSYKSFSKPELLEALAVKSNRRGLTGSQRLSRDLSLCTECADLLVEVEGQYRLIHTSVKDFLLKRSHNIPEYWALQSEAHSVLAEVCLKYLMLDDLRSASISTPDELLDLVDGYPLLEYASLYWGDHMHFSSSKGTTSEGLSNLCNQFLGEPLALDLSIKMLEFEEFQMHPFWHHGHSSALHILSIFNLSGLARTLPNLKLSINEHDYFNHLPMDYAMIYGSREMVIWLLDIYREDNTKGGILFQSATECFQVHLLASAAAMNWADVARSLAGLGFDKNLAFGRRSQTAIAAAVEAGSLDTLKVLIDVGADVNLPCWHPGAIDRDSPLMRAVHLGNADAVELLLEAGATVNFHKVFDESYLHLAFKRGQLDIVFKLLKAGADINSQDTWGQTALHFATMFNWNSNDTVSNLLKAGADVNIKTDRQKTALHFAAQHNGADIICMLLEAGAEVNSRDNENSTALHIAAARGAADIVRILLNSGADVDVVASIHNIGFSRTPEFFGCRTPLSLAVSGESFEVAKILLDAGASIGYTGSGSFNPVLLAAEENLLEILNLLVEHCPDIKESSGRDYNALHIAAVKNHFEVTDRLLRRFNDPLFIDEENGEGEIPLTVSLKPGRELNAWVLLEHGAENNLLKRVNYLPTGFFLKLLHEVIRQVRNGNTDSNLEAALEHLATADFTGPQLSAHDSASGSQKCYPPTRLTMSDIGDIILAGLQSASLDALNTEIDHPGDRTIPRERFHMHRLAWWLISAALGDRVDEFIDAKTADEIEKHLNEEVKLLFSEEDKFFDVAHDWPTYLCSPTVSESSHPTYWIPSIPYKGSSSAIVNVSLDVLLNEHFLPSI